MSQAAFIVCNDCKEIIDAKAATRVRVHAEVEEDNAPTLPAYVCWECLDPNKYVMPSALQKVTT